VLDFSPYFLGPKVMTMDRDLEKLREEISALGGWIESRKQELENELTRHSERYNDLLRLPTSSEEIISEHDLLESLKEELDSLNESRQVLILKRALLRKLEQKAP
jgi:predicted Holliday junction resolvase-like endonuclease